MKNEFPKRIIRVNGCHGCPYPGERLAGIYCVHPKVKGKKLIFVSNCIKNKKVHDNCPLEKVVQIITEAKE